MVTSELKTFRVLLDIKAECPSDAEELLNDYTGSQTHLDIIRVKRVKEN